MAPRFSPVRMIAGVFLALICAGCHRAAAPGPASASKTGARPAPAGSELYLPRGASREKVMIECGDGYRMSGEYVKRERIIRSMPGVIFLHDYGANRDKWYPLNYLTGARGYAVLSLDFRGHGESPTVSGNPPVRYDQLSPEDFPKMVQDVRNAVSYLAMQRGVAGSHLAIVGMGMGASVALLAAAEPWAVSIRSLILVSPGMNYHGLEVAKAAGNIKNKRVYIIVGKQDEYSWTAATELKELIKGKVEVIEEDSDAHGIGLMRNALANVPYWLNESLMAPLIEEQGGAAKRRETR